MVILKFDRRIAFVALLLANCVAISAATATPTPMTEPLKLTALQFLLGEWQADQTGGTTGKSTGGTTFSLSLQNRAILRTNYAQYPASDNTPASRHEDLMVIYEAGASVRADYYDSEGHVIRYSVVAPIANEIVFLSDVVAGEPRYRLDYKLLPNGLLNGEFALAPPNAPDQFKSYLSWSLRRAQK